MYIVLLNYKAPLEEIDYVLPDHCAWLDRQYALGYFLASGRRAGRTGDVFIARPMTREKLLAVLATDPFVLKRLASHEVVEFEATRTAPDLIIHNEALRAG
ncbi:YciI family protein [Kutzneria viridogrisea]|uniref:YCII-related domain-containing protein n=2 Tax=Kutzneria TaxID=43356 RepID=W5W7U9_9PSEU|nr:YciI family protein [Kutzneria albida]AHH94294.1 hypothetical protein KALB_920 [Kutzneria albida DSM 43870]MBA8929958.1 uncharacterized protein YciI [Kutzneria viridogrisea]